MNDLPAADSSKRRRTVIVVVLENDVIRLRRPTGNEHHSPAGHQTPRMQNSEFTGEPALSVKDGKPKINEIVLIAAIFWRFGVVVSSFLSHICELPYGP